MVKEKIGIVGGGSWGTALSLLLSEQGYEIDLWVYEPDLCSIMQDTRENTVYLPGFQLSPRIHPTSSLERVVRGKSIIVLVVPTHVARRTAGEFLPWLSPDCLIINAGKGIENDSLKTMGQVLRELVPPSCSIAAVSGPTFAVEIARRCPSALVAAAGDQKTAERVQAIFSGPILKVFTSTDLIGVELGGSLKNVIAIATGISDGLNLGFNARAAIITRGLVEIKRIGTRLGARPETFSGLSGMGDLVLTCTGDLSRNRSVGIKLGQGHELKKITENIKMVAEGVRTVKSAYRLKNRLNIQAAIIEETYHVLNDGKSPQRALEDLMKVETSTEFAGVKGLQ